MPEKPKRKRTAKQMARHALFAFEDEMGKHYLDKEDKEVFLRVVEWYITDMKNQCEGKV